MKKYLKKLIPFTYEITNHVIYDSEEDKTKQNPNYYKEYTKKKKLFFITWFWHIFTEHIEIRNKGTKKNGIGFNMDTPDE